MERPKRIIFKPMRYVTTSFSDEASRRQKVPPTNAVGEEIQKDIDDIREILDENPNNFNNNIIPRIEHASSHIHAHNTNININQFNNVSDNINLPPAIIPSYSAQSSNHKHAITTHSIRRIGICTYTFSFELHITCRK